MTASTARSVVRAAGWLNIALSALVIFIGVLYFLASDFATELFRTPWGDYILYGVLVAYGVLTPILSVLAGRKTNGSLSWTAGVNRIIGALWGGVAVAALFVTS